jgi:HlyD family type I secretion membrane fusion protein
MSKPFAALRAWSWPADAAETTFDGAPVIRRIYAVIGLGLVGFLLWCALTPLSGGVVSQGRVAVESNHKAVQHLEGGIVERIFVKNGETVTAGQELVRLRDTQSRGAYGSVDENYWGLRATQARLEAEGRGMASLSWPADVAAAGNQSAAVALKLDAERQAFVSRRREMSDKQAVLTQRIDELERQRDGAEAQRASYQDQLESVRSELADMRGLYEKGLTTRSRVLALERSEQGLKGNVGERVAELARLDSAIQETHFQIGQTQSERRSEVGAALEKVRADLSDMEGRRSMAGDVLNRATVRAPVAGVVMGLNIFTPGGVIKPGDTLMQIVPQGEALIVDAAIGPKDIASIRPGQTARVQFTAFPRTAPRLTGSVSYVSADTLTDPQKEKSAYDARISISAEQLRRLGDLKLVPGMPVEVIVETRKRSAMDYLFGPVQDIFSRAFREG